MKKSVWVIDDERDLCEVITIALKKDGFDVDCAFNLGEAGHKLTGLPDIVIVDDNLPDGSGLEYIQMHPVEFMQSYVIIISADPSMSLKQRSSYEGIRAFLPKPFSIELMKRILKPAQIE